MPNKSLLSYGASPKSFSPLANPDRIWEPRFAMGCADCWEKGDLIVRIVKINDVWEVFQNTNRIGREKDLEKARKIAHNFMSQKF